jgi:hypothetical protein
METPALSNRFDHLEQAAVDACSIIYLLKTGVFERLSALLTLVTTNEVFLETKWPRLPVRIESTPEKALSNDHGLFLLAREKNIPLISDDKEVLLLAREGGLDYYNSLMMLIFLEYRGKISRGNFSLYYERLMEEVHYSGEVILQAQNYRSQLSQPIQ